MVFKTGSGRYIIIVSATNPDKLFAPPKKRLDNKKLLLYMLMKIKFQKI